MEILFWEKLISDKRVSLLFLFTPNVANDADADAATAAAAAACC